MADQIPPYRSIEEAWLDCVGNVMPTEAEVSENPIEAIKATFYAGAMSAMAIAYHYGFVDMRHEISRFCQRDDE